MEKRKKEEKKGRGKRKRKKEEEKGRGKRKKREKEGNISNSAPK